MSGTALSDLETTVARLVNSRLRPVTEPPDLTPVQITAIYALLGFGALYLSDVYLPQLVRDPGYLSQLQALKGGVEVVITAGLILLLTTRSRMAVEVRNRRLDRLQAERTVLHRVFRHNLRQDLTVVWGRIEQLRASLDDEPQLGYCRTVIDRLNAVRRYQDKLARIERYLRPDVGLHQFDLTELVEEHPAIDDIRTAENVSLTMDVTGEYHVIAIAGIEAAIGEVLENAVKHPDREDVEVRVAIEENEARLVDVVVQDNGPGIPAHERQAIRRMREEYLTHSTGLGLWSAKLACTASGGDLTLPRDRGEGATVVLRLPEAYDRTIRRWLRRA